MAFAILIGVFGCGKDVTENTTTDSTIGKIRIRESDDNYEIIRNTVSFDNDGYLDDYDKISIDIPSDIIPIE